ncbi:MAG TPA: rhodanese-like domain-containing protein [Polyangia bacterium]|nr:rhodanese-like domain-containing protein [Polyangia bacterium]
MIEPTAATCLILMARPDPISVEIAAELYAEGRVQFVDARPFSDYVQSMERIPESVRVAPGEGTPIDEALRSLPRQRLIVAYCDEPDHAASAAIAGRARELGLGNASFLEGGFQAWKQSGLTTESIPAESPVVDIGPTS